MKILHISLWLGLSLCLLLTPSFNHAAQEGKVRLFILSGQSNMARLDPNVSFTPALKKAFPKDEVIVVKSAQGGQPIRRWYKGWKAPEDVKVKAGKGEIGDLYDLLMTKVNAAIKGKTIDSITFVWMQGESDAQRGPASVYEASMRGLIKQLRDDLKRKDVTVVIGRLNNYKKGEAGWDMVRSAQEKVVKEDPLARLVDTDNLDGKADLHHTQKGYVAMGQRFAEKAIESLTPQSAK